MTTQELKAGDPQEIGGYALHGRLGAGGMGEVFLGRSRGGRKVAVKIVRPHIADQPGFRDRFRREVEAAQRVGGFWTAPVIGADPDAETPWVASQYIPAPDLATLVADEGPLPAAELRSLGAGLSEALDSIHQAGLVHRDMKPSNVLVTDDGPRVIDFGISKALEGATVLTGTGTVIGTPGFMSPEQAIGGEVGAVSDVFSLGSVLVFAATGAGPFGEGTAPALLYRVVHDEPDLSQLPASLRSVVAACLTKKPEKRPRPKEVLDLLAPAGGDHAARPPVPAPPPSPTVVDDAAARQNTRTRTTPGPPVSPAPAARAPAPAPAPARRPAQSPRPVRPPASATPTGRSRARAGTGTGAGAAARTGTGRYAGSGAITPADSAYRATGTKLPTGRLVMLGFVVVCVCLYFMGNVMTVLTLLPMLLIAAVVVAIVARRNRRDNATSVQVDPQGLHFTSGSVVWSRRWEELSWVTVQHPSSFGLTVVMGLPEHGSVPNVFREGPGPARTQPAADRAWLSLSFVLPAWTEGTFAELHAELSQHAPDVYLPTRLPSSSADERPWRR